jgi:hypothetical protein
MEIEKLQTDIRAGRRKCVGVAQVVVKLQHNPGPIRRGIGIKAFIS